MDSILVSIVVLTYNQEAVISETLWSLYHQTYTNVEYILCDDCSSDNTWSMMLEFVPKLQQKGDVRLYRQPQNKGITANYNKAFSLCHGDLIVINEGDDLSLPHRVERLATVFKNEKPMLIQSNYDFYVDGNIIHNDKKTLMGGVRNGF